MDDTNSPFHQDELSAEDLEVLRAFHALKESTTDTPLHQQGMLAGSPADQPYADQSSAIESEDEMLVIFTTEAGEDIAAMRLALQQVEQDDQVDSPGLKSLKRSAHKMAGTAAAIGCDSMSTIAHYMELVIKLVGEGSIGYLTGLIALVHAVRALESTLQSIASYGYESKQPLLQLENEYRALSIDLEAAHTSASHEVAGDISSHMAPQSLLNSDRASPSIRVDLQHLDRLIQHTEKLIELDAPLENAQKQVEIALNELHAAQARLRRLEPLLSSLSVSMNTATGGVISDAVHPPSSLVARIFQEARERTGYVQQTKSNDLLQSLMIQESAPWDEMEIDRFTEVSVLAHSFTEAITDVATATSQLHQALAHVNAVMARWVSQVSNVRDDAFSLRSLPFSVLIARLKQIIELMAGAQEGRVQFEFSGESIEIDVDILEMLATPFQELVSSSIAEGLYFAQESEGGDEQKLRIWFNAHVMGYEVTIEAGFSLAASPEVVIALRDAVHRLYGSISVQEHAGMEMTLRLCLPHSKRVIHGLLVRAGDQYVIAPFSQVQRVLYDKLETNKAHTQELHPKHEPFAGSFELYHLNALLGFIPEKSFTGKTIRTALVLRLDSPKIAVEVDEIVGEVERLVKPLAAHLCRPGITCMAVDGSSNVLLVVNLPEMIRLKTVHQHAGVGIEADTLNKYELPLSRPPRQLRPKILIADDSVYIRRSVTQTLNHKGYDVLEAVDGVQTLEQLAKESPDLLLLDIEMPNLNGYDVLNIIHTNRRFPGLKIALLTSRSSEKHKQRGKELGAHAYLTKPCPQDLLLKTVRSLLVGKDEGAT